MTAVALERLVDRIRALPTLPSVVAELGRRVNDPRAGIDDVAHIVESDPALAAQVLRLANSSFFGLRCKVADVRQAVALLGFASIHNLALAAAVLERLKGPGAGRFDPDRFWQHALATAVAAKALAEARAPAHADAAFTAGLLHDIGKIVLYRWCGEAFEQALAAHAQQRVSLVAAERAMLGFDHPHVGRLLGEHWNFPATLLDAIEQHHPDGAAQPPPLALVVHVADVIVAGADLGDGGAVYLDPIHDAAWESLALTAETVDAALAESVARIRDALELRPAP